MSSNPFRRKPVNLEPGDAANRSSSPAKSSLRTRSSSGASNSVAHDNDSPDGPHQVKPAKKVRVLSPPPLSPDSPAWPLPPSHDLPRGTPRWSHAGLGIRAAEQGDPFDGSLSTDESDGGSAIAASPAGGAVPAGGRAPGNPFSKSSRDAEKAMEPESQRRKEGEVLKAANATSQSLDVDAFRNLLMTGKAKEAELTVANTLQAAGESVPSGKTATPANHNHHFPPQRVPDHQEPGKEKKTPPPPPSSRYGKTIREDGSASETESSPSLPRITASKPRAHRRNTDSGELFPRRTSAGLSPTLAAVEFTPTHASNSGASKKSAPAPPPRRGHTRSGSKGQAGGSRILASVDDDDVGDDDAPSDQRSSRVAEPSSPRVQGTRHLAAQQAPLHRPPPASRTISQPAALNAPPSSSFKIARTPISKPPLDHHHDGGHGDEGEEEEEEEEEEDVDGGDGAAAPPSQSDPSANPNPPPAISKLTSPIPPPPPPPPARNPSYRRPRSLNNVESANRRVSGEPRPRESLPPPPPPPPPPRQRGSSASSADVLPPRLSADHLRGELLPGQGEVDILADLSALQREVDALRGKMR